MAEAIQFDSLEFRTHLLQFARETALRALSGGAVVTIPRPVLTAVVGGLFVTFWHGEVLRGCMGTFAPYADLVSTVEEVTRLALRDPRFVSQPITAADLPAMRIEISLLTEPVAAVDPTSLAVGKHGIVIRHAGRSGCFLPKVAVDRGWSAEEFLSECCTMKAGLPANAWRLPDAEVLLFEAESFCETPDSPAAPLQTS